uniref:Uncharacterized protein n=1 Tax=Avena sativa TaxID=4498 RepID=A0ACD5XFI0_AVESA
MEQQPRRDQDIHADAPPPPLHRRRMSPLRIFFIAFVAVCALVGIIVLLAWLIYRPSNIQVSVDAATLSRLVVVNSTASPTALSFNLTAGLIITNPNRRVAVYYHLLRAEGIYQGQRFDRVALPISFQPANCADVVRAVLTGTSAGDGGGDQTPGALYPVDLWLDGVVRYRYGGLMTTSPSTLSVKCPLLLQLMVASGLVECTVNL